MNELYSALATGASVFAAGIFVFAPAVNRSQSIEDCVKELRTEKGRPFKPSAGIMREFVSGECERKPLTLQDCSPVALFLAEAGINIPAGKFAGICLASGLLSGFLAFFTVSCLFQAIPPWVFLCSGFFAGLSVPLFAASRRKRKRKDALLNSMPDAMDLLSAATASGMGFDASVRCISEHDSGPFIQELMIVLSDISHGAARREAFCSMAKRCCLDEVNAFVYSVMRASDTGISVSDVLSQQAVQLREERLFKAEDEANRVPVKMMIPLVTCIFPSIFIILLGPAVQSIAGTL